MREPLRGKRDLSLPPPSVHFSDRRRCDVFHPTSLDAQARGGDSRTRDKFSLVDDTTLQRDRGCQIMRVRKNLRIYVFISLLQRFLLFCTRNFFHKGYIDFLAVILIKKYFSFPSYHTLFAWLLSYIVSEINRIIIIILNKTKYLIFPFLQSVISYIIFEISALM